MSRAQAARNPEPVPRPVRRATRQARARTRPSARGAAAAPRRASRAIVRERPRVARWTRRRRACPRGSARAHPGAALYGLNACLALFARRPEAVRKVWLLESRIPALKAVLAHLREEPARLHRRGSRGPRAAQRKRAPRRRGVRRDARARIVAVELAARPAAGAAAGDLARWRRQPAQLRRDRCAARAHFGAARHPAAEGVHAGLCPAPRRASPKAARKRCRWFAWAAATMPSRNCRSAGFALAATVVRGGQSLYATRLPERLVLVMGAEQSRRRSGRWPRPVR